MEYIINKDINSYIIDLLRTDVYTLRNLTFLNKKIKNLVNSRCKVRSIDLLLLDVINKKYNAFEFFHQQVINYFESLNIFHVETIKKFIGGKFWNDEKSITWIRTMEIFIPDHMIWGNGCFYKCTVDKYMNLVAKTTELFDNLLLQSTIDGNFNYLINRINELIKNKNIIIPKGELIEDEIRKIEIMNMKIKINKYTNRFNAYDLCYPEDYQSTDEFMKYTSNNILNKVKYLYFILYTINSLI